MRLWFPNWTRFSTDQYFVSERRQVIALAESIRAALRDLKTKYKPGVGADFLYRCSDDFTST
jgi:hypothetical protein